MIVAVIDVVVPCGCGSRFSFSVEPVDGRLPEGAELLCPSCGKDGVPLANRMIEEKVRKLEREVARKREAEEEERARRAAFPNPQRKAAKPEPKSDAYAIPEQAAGDPFAKAREKEEGGYSGLNKIKGIAGAAAGAFLGATLWTAVVYFTGYEIGYVAVAVGALAGLGSRIVGGGRDYHLGLVAAGCALVAILLGQFCAAKIYIDKTVSVELANFEYERRLENAKEAQSLRTEQEYREFIAAARSTMFRPVAAAAITPKDVREFQMTELPPLKEFAGGKPSREQFIEQERKIFLEKITSKDVFNAAVSPYLFLWVFVGIGAAWRLASDHGTSVE